MDFEFTQHPGENPEVICLVAYELVSGKLIRIWKEQLYELSEPPYGIGPEDLFVAYYASAEINCHIALGWALPERILDLYVEFKNFTNGIRLKNGRGLVGALVYFGLPSIGGDTKNAMRDIAIRGGPFSKEEKGALLEYCESDVTALSALLGVMSERIDIYRACTRGRYMRAAAQMESEGIPVDIDLYQNLRSHWPTLQNKLIKGCRSAGHFYEGRTFKTDKFSSFLQANSIPWPRLPSGGLKLDDTTFKQMAVTYPELSEVRDLRSALSLMRLNDLPVGKDFRNRTMLSAFASKTGRNQPSTSKFLFGPAVWLRGLIKPPEGFAIAYIDYSQQEVGIAAALSGDQLLQEAYVSEDPYLAFAKQAGAAPTWATKMSHKEVRDQFKACVLAVQYGMGAESLALRIKQPVARARELLRFHRAVYRVFWNWSDASVNQAMTINKLQTVLGWHLHIEGVANPRSIRNFPMQANGAEMLRLACCELTEAGIRVCAPVHDAVLILDTVERMPSTIKKAQRIMGDASELILEGFRLNSDVEVFTYPDRYSDSRGDAMWKLVNDELRTFG